MSNQLHDDVLNFLETYRTKHPDFLYWLRQRNTKNRLNEGYWFQGNLDYAFVGLYDRTNTGAGLPTDDWSLLKFA
jgi:hypothetical protein